MSQQEHTTVTHGELVTSVQSGSSIDALRSGQVLALTHNSAIELWSVIKYDGFVPSFTPSSVTFVSSHGRLMRNNSAIIDVEAYTINKGGYPVVSIVRPGLPHTITVHRVVCWTFKGPPPTPEHSCDHKDGNRRNNHTDNLFWVTPIVQFNNRGEKRFDKLEPGEERVLKKPRSEPFTIKYYKVEESRQDKVLRAFLNSDTTVKELAGEFGVLESTVCSYVCKALPPVIPHETVCVLLNKLNVDKHTLETCVQLLESVELAKRDERLTETQLQYKDLQTFVQNSTTDAAPQCTNTSLVMYLSRRVFRSILLAERQHKA